jgi:hypothetical protein
MTQCVHLNMLLSQTQQLLDVIRNHSPHPFLWSPNLLSKRHFFCFLLTQQGKVHVRELAHITTVPHIRMVTQFVVDPMHTADGGLLKHFLTTYLGKETHVRL